MLSPPVYSLQAKTSFGPGLLFLLILEPEHLYYFPLLRVSMAVLWQELAQEHLSWPWWWLFLPTHAHDTWPSWPLHWDKDTAGEKEHAQQPARHRVQAQ